MEKNVVVIQRSELPDQQEHTNQKSEVTDAVDDKRLLAGIRSRVFEEEESNQQIRREANALPAHEQQQIARRQHQCEHEEHEQIQVAEEAVVTPLTLHVRD